MAHQGKYRDDPGMDPGFIKLERDADGNIDPDLFDTVARQAAREIAKSKYSNKTTQLRRFYDEIVAWDDRVRQSPEKFREYLPFIRMLNAKAAYAEGRKLVDASFVNMLAHCLRSVDSAEAMHLFKLFFEAFMGFYKLERPKD